SRQWDTAARLKPEASGPIGSDPAVNRSKQGLRPVNESKNDGEKLGFLDMGGNGTEFTRDVTAESEASRKALAGRRAPLSGPPPDALVILRGQRHISPRALTYEDLREQQDPQNAQVQFYQAASLLTGFRIVIETNAPAG